jgi:L-amino acid N-acyltransferase YncA
VSTDKGPGGLGLFASHMVGWVALRGGREAGVAAWDLLNRFRPKIGYRFSVEDSIYVALAWRGRGVGKPLPPPLIEAARPLGMHAVPGSIDSESEAGIRL